MTNKDKYYFNKAKEASKLSDFNKVNIGCVAVYKNIILAKGFNTNKTNPIQHLYNQYRDLCWNNGVEPKAGLHAEMMVITKIKDLDIHFNQVKLYIYREDMNGNIAMCKPCRACTHAIKDLGIKEIYYTTNKEYKKECIT